METFSLTIALLVCASALFYLHRRRKLQALTKMGVVTAGNPNFLFGNLLDFWGYTLSSRKREWTKKYGKTYGYYEGPQPIIVSSDLDFLQEVMVKQFGSFNARKLYPIQDDPENDPNMHMFLARNERWKRLRLCANPAFSTAKLKLMFPTILSCDERLMKNMALNSKKDGGFNVYDFYQRFTLDVIFECAFGVSVNAQENPKSLYLKKLREAFSEMTVPIFVVLAMVFFELRNILKLCYGFLLSAGIMKNPFLYIIKYLIPNIVKVRQEQFVEKASGEKDLIQLMLEVYHSNEGKTNVADATDDASLSRSRREISLKEVESQVELFMLAGYETSSTTLAYCTYLLATNPHVQKRLQKEIDAFYESEFGPCDYKDSDTQELTYDKMVATGKLPYLDLVVHETLRIYPIASTVVTRQCMVDTEIKGISIPAGTNIVPDIWTIHNDPEIWGPEDPKNFYPDRFAPDLHNNRHPLSFLSFGAGPRNCIGMRFALVEVKLALVRLLRRYDILECAKTEKPLQLREMEVISPKNGVYVSLQARQKATPTDCNVQAANKEAIQA